MAGAGTEPVAVATGFIRTSYPLATASGSVPANGEDTKPVRSLRVQHPSNTLKTFIKARFSTKDSSGLFLTLLLLMLIVAAFVFGAIAEDVVNRDPLTITDARFSAWLHEHSVPSLTRFMLVVTHIHSTLGVTVMTLAICAYLWIKRLRIWVLRLMLSVFGGMLLNALLKQVFMRPRPRFENPLLIISSYSFPSGHTMMATVFYGALCALFVAKVRDWRARGLAVVVSASLILLVGFSRIYLGVHYLSDVMAAIAEGLAWLAFSVISVEELGRRREKRSR
jgi:undecaprenyl-diphosphatase